MEKDPKKMLSVDDILDGFKPLETIGYGEVHSELFDVKTQLEYMEGVKGFSSETIMVYKNRLSEIEEYLTTLAKKWNIGVLIR